MSNYRELIAANCKREKYSKEYTQYWLDHIFCEAKTGQHSGHPHHIRTRGAGGDDSPDNLLALSLEKHNEIHTLGPWEFAVAHPWLKEKIFNALMERSKA